MSYKGVDVIEVNTTRNIPSRRLNQNTPQGKEFDSLIKKLFNKTKKIIEETSKETNTPEETVRDKVDENEYPSYEPFTDEQVRDMLKERAKNRLPKNPEHTSGTLINRLRPEIDNLPQFKNNDGRDHSNVLPVVPDDIIDEIVSDSTEERAYIIEGLTISDQELKELSGLLNPIGTADIRTEMLDKLGNEYRLKALRETKNIYETAKLKADYITVTEKGEKPENQEATEIIGETATNNESIKDLTRLERFKKWAKENSVSLCISNLYCWHHNNNHIWRSEGYS